MSTIQDTGSDNLIKLKAGLKQVTQSLKKRNDALEHHLNNTGWTIRRMTLEKPTTKDSNRPKSR
jgi:hypothetical protein